MKRLKTHHSTGLPAGGQAGQEPVTACGLLVTDKKEYLGPGYYHVPHDRTSSDWKAVNCQLCHGKARKG